MLIEDEAQIRSLEELGEQRFARLDWLASQIAAVSLKQIERGKHGVLASVVAAN